MTINNLEDKSKSEVPANKPNIGQKTTSWSVPLTPERKAFRESARQMYLDYLESEKRAYSDSRPIKYGLRVA